MMRALFLADQFADSTRSAREKHPGGAELTDDAALAVCPWPVTRARWKELDTRDLDQYDAIVVGNSQSARADQLSVLAGLGRYVLFEHDVRICRWNGNFFGTSDAAHRVAQRCWCPHPHYQELIAHARGIVFLTERQRRVYEGNPFYAGARTAVLGSSLFGQGFFERVRRLRSGGAVPRAGTAIVYSVNTIKGTEQARRFAEGSGWTVREIRSLAPEGVLDVLESSQRLVYLPRGLEPAGRVPVEARLLGCEVFVNGHVGVAGEPIWQLRANAALDRLEAAPRRFWSLVETLLDSQPAERRPMAQWLAPLRQISDAVLEQSHAFDRVVGRFPVISPRSIARTLAIKRYEPW